MESIFTTTIESSLQLTTEFIRQKGRETVANWGKKTIDKTKDDGKDVATNFDIAIEKGFSELIETHFPDHGFMGEDCPELFRDGTSGYVWEIDSIDGTKFFAAEVPLWCITFGLKKDGERMYGCIYNAVSDQLYIAKKGEGAYLNDRQISVTTKNSLQEIQVSIDISNTTIGTLDFAEKTLSYFAILQKNAYRVRSIGSGALSLAWLAQGFFGVYVNPLFIPSKEVDLAGGLLLAQEAGAIVFQKEIAPGVSCLIVGNPELVEQTKKLIFPPQIS